MIYALVHYPHVDASGINRFRMKYDPQFELIEPHITLMFPMPDSIGKEDLLRHLERVLGSWQAFPVHLRGIQISSDDHIFLLLQEGSANIIRLHDEIYTDILADYWRKDLPYVPHITLGVLQKDSASRERALDEVKGLGIDYRCMLDKLHLLKINDDRSKIVWSKEFSLA